TLDDALRPVPRVVGGRLEVLPSGPLPPNPSEVLRTSRFGKLLDALSDLADYVLIDSTPLLSVTDALVASRWVDGCICVARVGLTTQRRLAKGLERLAQSTAPLLGIVVNGVGTNASSGYYYYYREGSPRRRFLPRRIGARRHSKDRPDDGSMDFHDLVSVT